MRNLITSTPRRPYIIAPSETQKQRMIDNIDRCCSLYYITMGSIYTVCQSAIIDARDFICKHEPTFYKQQVKYNIKNALAAYDKWNDKMKNTLAERYQIWLDVSDAVDEEMKPLVSALYYSIDNLLLKHNIPCSKVYARMEVAAVLLQLASSIYNDLFNNILKRIGTDIRRMFLGGDATDIYHYWQEAMHFIYAKHPVIPDVDLNSDATINLAVDNIVKRLTAEHIYNRGGEYALRLNPDQWKCLDKATRMKLKNGLPISE